jgi:hypothetical protein
MSTLSEYKAPVRERDDAKAEPIAWTEARERGGRGRLLAILALSLPAMAEAASVATPIVGCKAEADAKRILEFIAKRTGKVQNAKDYEGGLLLPDEGHACRNR